MSTPLAYGTIGIYERPVELLQNLIRFDTSNPPGNEAECIGYVNGLLTDAGCPTTILARDPGRPNLVARLPGRGTAPPLLLYGHVDVVSTESQSWTHPPFAADVADGYVWGRGALDMKSGVAMLAAAFLKAKACQLPLAGDLVLALVSGEETGGECGAKWLVENHAGLFQDVRYALGETGGFSLTIAGRRFYPMMVSEKSPCMVKATLQGKGGHGSLVQRHGVAAQMGQVLQKLSEHRLPVHVTPVARQMLETAAANVPFPASLALRQLTNPTLADKVLDIIGAQGAAFDPLLHNTVNVTTIRAGEQQWTVPGQGTIDMAGSVLPGYGSGDLLAELHALLGPDVQLECEWFDPGVDRVCMDLFDMLASVLREMEPAGVPLPLVMPSPTDGRHFSRLGIQTYGFLPMKLPADFPFVQLHHAADERIPVEAVAFGAEAVYKALQRYGA